MKIEVPKLTGRIYKPFDWYGWIMAILGLTLMAKFGGLLGTPPNWWMVAACFLCFWEYAIRVAYGRVYKFIYYDTVLHNMYEIKLTNVDNDTETESFFVSAETDQELALYMELHYPTLTFEVVATHALESFIKTESFI
jgi:hypothetical protein